MFAAACSLLAPSDAELRGAGPGDGASPDAAAAPVFHDVASPAYWSVFDITSLFAAAHDFAGGTFDGRYVYLAPRQGGVVARYDTGGADLSSVTAWTIFDASALSQRIHGYGGAVFDGRYVYFVPYGGYGYANGVVTRYDTQVDFNMPGAWRTFDTTTVNPRAEGFVGAAFDGRFVYFAPERNAFANSDGTVARYDTRADFQAAASWATFDVGAFSPGGGAGGFNGVVFDGRYVFFLQNQNAGAPCGGQSGCVVTRYDTSADFATQSSWSFFNVETINPNASGFFGGAFDGRYLYTVPSHAGAPSILGRYDTRGSFTASWMTFDTSTLDAGLSGFAGGAFDGRYVYLVPSNAGAPDGVVARVDSAAPDFRDPSAWSTFDITRVNANAKGFTGAIFDGHHLYFVPRTGGAVARFDAKQPPGLPALPGFHGSFF
jgi:hypothetical protein